MADEQDPIQIFKSSSRSESAVSDFYNGRCVFITGSTGFVGKVLLEKLLRSCPAIGRIYLLVRSKKGQNPQERVKNLMNNDLFKSLSASIPNISEKVIAVAGDITKPQLGISLEDEETLIHNVSVIFHSAATVKFDEDLADSIKMNVYGTMSIIELARKIKSLSALVDVSTAYSHCYKDDTIEEKFYTMPQDCGLKGGSGCSSPEEIIMVYNQAKASGRNITEELIGVFPNTYTFTKAMAEKMLMETASDLPLAIMRPSIITAAWKEPIPGWIDNFNGATGIFAAIGTGVLHTMHVKSQNRADFMPVDICASLLCVLAWKVGTTSHIPNTPRDIKIYNCTSGPVRPITWSQIETMMLQYVHKNPMEQMVWYPSCRLKSSRMADRVSRVFVHWIPAYCYDMFAFVTRKKPFNLVKKIKLMTSSTNVLEYFSTGQWTWDNTNVENLFDELSLVDQQKYTFSLRDFEGWGKYLEAYGLGIRQFVLKGDPNTLEKSRKKLWQFHIAHRMLKYSPPMILLYLLLCWPVENMLPAVYETWSTMWKNAMVDDNPLSMLS